MNKRAPRNIAASRRARLLEMSRHSGEDFQFLLDRWVVERFLFRLSVSEHKEQFVLKGAMLFLAWTGTLYRPTRDLDLLGWGDSDVDGVVRAVRSICRVKRIFPPPASRVSPPTS